jgi:hypothetical protein
VSERSAARIADPALRGLHVAHLNIALLRHGWEDPRSEGFTASLERVNALAAKADGFVWALGDKDMTSALEDPNGWFGGDPRGAATLSVWTSATALHRFTYETLHGAYFRRRGDWFAPLEGPTHVVWPVAKAHEPTIAEAAGRLARLRRDGPTDAAFDLPALKDAGTANPAYRTEILQ